MDHDKYVPDLRIQSTVLKFFNRASILHPNRFFVTYEVLKHQGFDRLPYPSPNSRYSRKAVWIIYPSDEVETESSSTIALIPQHLSNNLSAPSSAASSTTQAGPSSGCITSLRPLSYNSSLIAPLVLPTSTVRSQESGEPTKSTSPVS